MNKKQRETVLQLIVEATAAASREYGEWNDSYSAFDGGVESLISTTVARTIYQNRHFSPFNHISMETSPDELIEHKKIFNSKPADIRNGRIDVVVWNDMDPLGLIEAKRHFSFSGMKEDLDRTTELVRLFSNYESGGRNWGAVCGIQWSAEAENEDRMGKRVESFGKKFGDEFNAFHLKSTHIAASAHIPKGEFGRNSKPGRYYACGALFWLKE